MKKQTYSAEQAAQLVGISKAALRFYEKNKIIGPILRDKNGYRRYTDDDIDWINVILIIRKIGIPIKSLIGIQETSMQERVAYLIDYRKTIQADIEKLKQSDHLLVTKIDYLKKNVLPQTISKRRNR